jgi:hypothetical protein
MVWTLLQDFQRLTPAEQKLLWTNKAANKLTEASWKYFTHWVEAKDPNVPQTQRWLSEMF